MPRRRTTQRFRRSVLWACQKFSDLKSVRLDHGVSNAFIYKVLFEQIELKLRTVQNPWPKKIGIDEHCAFRSQSERFVTG